MKLVVTIPALNEDKTIAQVVNGVPRDIPGITEVEVIVVNDGSTDQTAAFAEAAGATVINVHGRPGLGMIFRTGLERSMRHGADIVVNIDGDGQFNPADIAKPRRTDSSRRCRLRHLLALRRSQALADHAAGEILRQPCGHRRDQLGLRRHELYRRLLRLPRIQPRGLLPTDALRQIHVHAGNLH